MLNQLVAMVTQTYPLVGISPHAENELELTGMLCLCPPVHFSTSLFQK